MKKYFLFILACLTQNLSAIPDATEAAFRGRGPKFGAFHAHTPEIKESPLGRGNLQAPHLGESYGSSMVIGVPRNIASLPLSVQQFASKNVTSDVELYLQLTNPGTAERNSLFLADWAFPAAKSNGYTAEADAEVTFFNGQGIKCETLAGRVAMDTESWGSTKVSEDGVPIPNSILSTFKKHNGGSFYAVGTVTYPSGKQRSFITLMGVSNDVGALIGYAKAARGHLGRNPQISDLYDLMQKGKKHIGSTGLSNDEIMQIYDATAMLGYVEPKYAGRYAKLGAIKGIAKKSTPSEVKQGSSFNPTQKQIIAKALKAKKKLTPAQVKALKKKLAKRKLSPAQIKALRAKLAKANALKKSKKKR